MSWHTISVKPRGGPPQAVWLEGGWCKLDNVGPAVPLPEGGRDFRVMIGRDKFTLRQNGYSWHIEGSGPDDVYY